MYQDFSLHAGSVLDSGKFKYTIVKVLGCGTFGITYLATIPVQGSIGSLEMKVAVKEFFMKDVCSRQSDGSLQEMSQGGLVYNYAMKFRKEAENLSRLEHPQVVRVLDVFEANNTVYYAMEFVEGDNLNEYLKGRGPMSEDEALSFISSIASPLAYMHEHKMLHLDLKPGNVMRRSSDGKCVLIDFGLSKYYADNGEPESSTNIGMGTPGYAPIEQAQAGRNGQVYPTLDIYALGGTFYKLLTGETPPEASELLDGFPREKFLYPGSGISVSVVDAIEKTMSPRRLDRPQSVRDFLKLLDSLQSDTSSPADDFTVLDENKKHSAASGPSSASGASGPSEPSGSSNSQGVSGNFRENDDKVAKGGVSDKPSSNPNRAKRWIIVACVIVGLIAGFFLLKSLMSGGGADDGQVAALQREQYVKDSLEDVQRSQHIKDSIAAVERAEQEEAAREEAARQEAARQEAARQEAARQEAARQEAERQAAEEARSTTGTINGHQWVDLGLSVKWATCNVGASSPSDYGNYYAWGETRTKSEYTVDNSSTYGKSMGDISGDIRYDAARANWGGTWRLPTETEMQELVDKCTWTWTSQGGHNGYRVTGPSGSSIFLPAAAWRHQSVLYYPGVYGRYWTSTPYEHNEDCAFFLEFAPEGYFREVCRVEWYGYFNGSSIRPVSY